MENFSFYFINVGFVLKFYLPEENDLIIYSLSFETWMFMAALYAVIH